VGCIWPDEENSFMEISTKGVRRLCLTAIAITLVGLTSTVSAATLLGSAADFAVLGGAAVTNTGATTLKGDLGVSPGTSITGLETITITGAVDDGDATAMTAKADAQSAFTSLAAMTPEHDLTGQDLGGMTLTPGVYAFASTAQLTGVLTLDFSSDPGGSFVFQIGSAITTAAGSSVVADGSAAGGVYWDVGSSATLGADTAFVGNILAAQSITLVTGSSIGCGRAIALAGAVTLDTHSVSNSCGAIHSDFVSGGGGVPEASTWALMITGIGMMGGGLRRRSGISVGR
jgi:hypothetical protein